MRQFRFPRPICCLLLIAIGACSTGDAFLDFLAGAPVWTRGYPRLEDVGRDSVRILVSLEGEYDPACLVLPAGTAEPSSDGVFAGGLVVSNLAPREVRTVVLAGLSPGTAYVAFAAARDRSGVPLGGPQRLPFTTQEVPVVVLVPDMLPVPVGSDVTIGWSGIAAPEHTVPTISAFRIGKLEVDWALWTNVRDWALANGYCFANPGMMGGGSGSKTAAHPVTSISHRDMLVWCNALSRRSGLTVAYYTESDLSTEYHDAADGNAGLVKVGGSGANDCVDWNATGYRLPTETEWEYAARWTATGLSSGMWVSGASAASMDDDYAWHAGNSAGQTAAGGLKLANALGLRDMSGNVAEFCWDWFADYAVTPPFTDADSRGVASGSWRVVRGGSFLTIAPLETSRRANMEPTTDVTDNAVGFRVVRSGAP